MQALKKIPKSKWDWLKRLSFDSGNHHSADKGACVMEAVSYIAGEPWSDHPKCVCPIIGQFMRSWNDALPDNATRDRLLKPLVKIIIGTKATKQIEQQRGFMCVDWIVREFTPTWLELVPSLKVHAEALRKSPEITDVEKILSLTTILVDAQKSAAAAWATARDAAWDAAWATAWDAARDAARAAAWATAWDAAWDAAWATAWDAARDAAWAAAWAAARDAARDALKPTIEKLQQSTSELVKRMSETK